MCVCSFKLIGYVQVVLCVDAGGIKTTRWSSSSCRWTQILPAMPCVCSSARSVDLLWVESILLSLPLTWLLCSQQLPRYIAWCYPTPKPLSRCFCPQFLSLLFSSLSPFLLFFTFPHSIIILITESIYNQNVPLIIVLSPLYQCTKYQ